MGTDKKDKLLIRDKKMALIGLDSKDRVYIGRLNNENNVDELIVVTYKNNETNRESFKLNVPVRIVGIVINNAGKAYIINNSKKIITEFRSKVVTSFEGTFLQLLEGIVVSTNNGMLETKKVK